MGVSWDGGLQDTERIKTCGDNTGWHGITQHISSTAWQSIVVNDKRGDQIFGYQTGAIHESYR